MSPRPCYSSLPAALTQVFIWLNHTPTEEATLIWIYLGAFFALALSRTFCGVNKGRENFRVETAVYSLQALLMLLGTLFIILSLRVTESIPQARMALVGRLSGLLLGAVLTARLWNTRLRLVPNWRVIKDLLGAGFPFALQAALATAYMQIDTLFIRNLLGIEETAYYQASLRIIVGVNMLATFLINAFYPRVASSFKNGIATASLKNSLQMMRALTLVGIFISFGLFLAAEPLLHLVYGAKMAPSVPVFRVAAFIPLVRFISGGYGIVLISIHRQNVQVVGAVAATVIIAALDWFLVPRARLCRCSLGQPPGQYGCAGDFLAVILKELRSTLDDSQSLRVISRYAGFLEHRHSCGQASVLHESLGKLIRCLAWPRTRFLMLKKGPLHTLVRRSHSRCPACPSARQPLERGRRSGPLVVLSGARRSGAKQARHREIPFRYCSVAGS